MIVEDTLLELSKTDETQLLSLLDRNFGSHETDRTRYSVSYTWITTSGDVKLVVFRDWFKITYIDYTEKVIRKQILEEFDREWER